MTEEPQVKIWREGAAGRLRLNRPKALNALTLDMIRLMDTALRQWQDDPAVAMVILDGEGPRALCAGGDIRALYDSGKARDGQAAVFWQEEYRLNSLISRYPKPYVAFQDGIVMGGGVGVSAHGAHRIVTETTVLAMPEVGIGLIPDVGGTWLLSRAPGQLGTALAVTGDRFGAADAILAGFSDRMIPRERRDEVCAALVALPATAGNAEVSAVLDGFSVEPEAGPWGLQRDVIDRLFAHDSIEQILAALDAEATETAQKWAATIRKKSPTSLKLALKAIRLARSYTSLEQALGVEYRLVLRTLEGNDFFEGVRVTIIDKGQAPDWQPATVEAVSAESIDAYFEPLAGGELSFD